MTERGFKLVVAVATRSQLMLRAGSGDTCARERRSNVTPQMSPLSPNRPVSFLRTFKDPILPIIEDDELLSSPGQVSMLITRSYQEFEHRPAHYSGSRTQALLRNNHDNA